MRNHPVLIVAIAAMLLGACGDDYDKMSTRTSEVGACLDTLVEDTAEHYDAVLGEDDIAHIRILEEYEYWRSGVELDELDYWIGEVDVCRDWHGHAVDLGNIHSDQIEVRRELALHRLTMAFAEEPDGAYAEEERHQLMMMARLGELREHQLAMEARAERYACPIDE